LRVPVLDLSSNSLTASGLQVILTRPAGGELPAIRLRELDLGQNPELGNDGARVLAASPHTSGLRALRVAGCAIGDDGVRALADSPHLNQLVALDLANNPASDAGFRAFLETRHMRGLRRLILPAIGGPSKRTREQLEMRGMRDRA
jgi:hypothetical protein